MTAQARRLPRGGAPNVAWFDSEGSGPIRHRLFLKTLRDIELGEELLIQYDTHVRHASRPRAAAPLATRSTRLRPALLRHTSHAPPPTPHAPRRRVHIIVEHRPGRRRGRFSGIIMSSAFVAVAPLRSIAWWRLNHDCVWSLLLVVVFKSR